MPEPTLDPAAFEEALDQALAVLELSKKDGKPWLTAAAISKTLRDSHEVGLDWRTVDARLKSAGPELVARRKRKNRKEFSILRKGEQRLSNAGPSVVLVDPINALQSVITLHGVLKALVGEARICDPYLDPVTVEHLQACPVASRVMLLTHRIREEGPVRRLLAAARTEGRSIEVRVSPTASLHDRYLLDDTSMILMGGSLNGFGKKQSFLVKLGEDIRQTMRSDFDARWRLASAWI